MRLLLAVVAALFVSGTLGCGAKIAEPKPENAEVKTALVKFLNIEYGRSGDLEITGPTNVSVGSFNSEFQGWPVYADYNATYTHKGMTMHRNSIAKIGVPACYVKEAAGQYFCFKSDLEKRMENSVSKMQDLVMNNPEFTKSPRKMSKEARRQMQQQMQEAVQEMNTTSMQEIRGMMRDMKKPKFGPIGPSR